MKITLLAAALAAAASASAGLAPSSANSVRDVPPAEPIFESDLRVRNARGKVRADILDPAAETGGPLYFESPSLRDGRSSAPRPWNLPYPKPITPEGDGEFPAIHHVPKPDIRFPVPMPVAKGEFIDPKMPMKTPDPAVDYKLHIREMTPPASGDAKK
ncbi:MAG: hypothetical protein HYV96_04995 [Opitutae bacterium]|nr:hypothetical protein [Opitutae bacterium]